MLAHSGSQIVYNPVLQLHVLHGRALQAMQSRLQVQHPQRMPAANNVIQLGCGSKKESQKWNPRFHGNQHISSCGPLSPKLTPKSYQQSSDPRSGRMPSYHLAAPAEPRSELEPWIVRREAQFPIPHGQQKENVAVAAYNGLIHG